GRTQAHPFGSEAAEFPDLFSGPEDSTHGRRRQERFSQRLLRWQRIRQLQNRCTAEFTLILRQFSVPRAYPPSAAIAFAFDRLDTLVHAARELLCEVANQRG